MVKPVAPETPAPAKDEAPVKTVADATPVEVSTEDIPQGPATNGQAESLPAPGPGTSAIEDKDDPAQEVAASEDAVKKIAKRTSRSKKK